MGRIETGGKTLATCVVLALGLGGCFQSYASPDDGDADVHADADADAEPDVGDCVPPCRIGFTCFYGICLPTGADADADADGGITCVTGAECASGICLEGRCVPVGGDAGADADASTCAGGWFDPASRLCWQVPWEGTGRPLDDAIAYCAGLSLGGHGPGSWHLPTIDELRSLIRGCPGTHIGGACGVTDSCTTLECSADACLGCEMGGGPGGCYWPDGLADRCESFWSSSDDLIYGERGAWVVGFVGGWVAAEGWPSNQHARCVRPGP